MVVKNVLHMNAGSGDSSYAQNSNVQRTVILKIQPIIEDSIKGMHIETLPKCFNLADLGCSSGPNTLLSIYNIMETIYNLCQENYRKVPEFHAYLNDLPENDFNNIFKLIPAFYDKLKTEKGDNFGPCFITGTPGSFYGRIFPSNSLHFVLSSCSVHWLSQVPGGLENNKENIYIAAGSPPDVFVAYMKQFESDFSTFLRSRSKEIVSGGRMILTLVGRRTADPSSSDSCSYFELLTDSLISMVEEGIVEEADLFGFNLPLYHPYKDEVEAIIKNEDSFTVENLHNFEVDWGGGECDGLKSYATTMTSGIRAVVEPMLAAHFGDSIIQDLFCRYAENVCKLQSMDKLTNFIAVVSLTRK